MGFKGKLSAMPPFSLRPVLRGLIVTYLAIIIMTLIFSLIFYLTPLSESWMSTLGVIIATLALFCGGYTAGRRAGTRGLLHGLFVGVFFLILLIISSAAQGIAWSTLIIKIIYSLLAAAIGGISGIK